MTWLKLAPWLAILLLLCGNVAQCSMVQGQAAQMQALDQRRQEETSRANSNADAVTTLLQDAALNARLANEVRDLRSDLDRRSTAIIENIVHAPQSADGPVAPVLHDTLVQLRSLAATPSDASTVGPRAAPQGNH